MKQYRTTVLLFTLLLSSIAWGQNKVNFLSSNNDVMTLRVTAYASKVQKAIEAAELEVIKTILFRGVPGSQQNTALVGIDENETMNNHKEYFEDFYGNKRYSSFILSSIPLTKFAKDLTKKKCITMDIAVNLKALRTDLEQHNIIRKFGL